MLTTCPRRTSNLRAESLAIIVPRVRARCVCGAGAEVSSRGSTRLTFTDRSSAVHHC